MQSNLSREVGPIVSFKFERKHTPFTLVSVSNATIGPIAQREEKVNVKRTKKTKEKEGVEKRGEEKERERKNR